MSTRGAWQWLAERPCRALAAGVLLSCALRLPFVAAPLGDDEGGYLYIAQQWPGPGHWLYGRQWVDRPPALILVFKAVALLGGSPVAMRVVAMALAAVLVTGAWYVGKRLAGGDGAVAAALSAGALASDPTIYGHQLVSDGVGAAFVTASVALVLAAVHHRDRRPARVAIAIAGAAGFVAVLAFLCKQSALLGLVAGPMVLVVDLRRRWSLLLAWVVGVLVPLALTAGWAATGPGLRMLVDATYTFRVDAARVVAGSTSAAPAERIVPFLLILVVSGLVLPLAHLAWDLATRRGAWHLRGAVVVSAACLAAVIVASLNWFSHYWLAVVPLAAVGTAIAFVPGERRRWTRVAPRAVVVCTVLAVGVNVAARVAIVGDEPVPAVSQFVAAAAEPDDTMIVTWGQPNLLEDAGLHSPYPFSWSLPVRVEDPHLRLFAATLAGRHAPTWLLEIGHLDDWQLETATVAGLVASRYHVAAVVCGHEILLRNGVRRPVGAARQAVADVPC